MSILTSGCGRFQSSRSHFVDMDDNLVEHHKRSVSTVIISILSRTLAAREIHTELFRTIFHSSKPFSVPPVQTIGRYVAVTKSRHPQIHAQKSMNLAKTSPLLRRTLSPWDTTRSSKYSSLPISTSPALTPALIPAFPKTTFRSVSPYHTYRHHG